MRTAFAASYVWADETTASLILAGLCRQAWLKGTIVRARLVGRGEASVSHDGRQRLPDDRDQGEKGSEPGEGIGQIDGVGAAISAS